MELARLTPGLQCIISEISEVARYVWEGGWSSASGGNLSVDVTDAVREAGLGVSGPEIELPVTVLALGGRCLLVTVSGARFRDIPRAPEKTLLVVRISDDGASYQVVWGGNGGDGKPTMEFIPHLRIHAYLRSNNLPYYAVLHTHPQHIIAMTHLPQYRTRDFERVLQTSQSTAWMFRREGVGMARYMPMGSEQLADHTAALLRGRRVVVWERHGAVAVGRDVQEAFDVTDILDKAAQVFLLCVTAGYEPRRMTPDELSALGK